MMTLEVNPPLKARSRFDRLFDLAGSIEPKYRESKIRAFQFILILHLWAEVWNLQIDELKQTGFFLNWDFIGANILFMLGFSPLMRRWVCAGFSVIMFRILWLYFPNVGTHNYLDFLFPAVVAVFNDKKDEEQELFLRTMRLLVTIIFFHVGLQKVLHGYYFRGEFLSVYIAQKESFRQFFELFLPRDEIARLAQYDWRIGDGPYRINSPILVLMTNTIYLLEMGHAIALLCLRRFRPYAVAAAVMTIFLIEVAAREFFYGAMIINAILLYLETDLNRRLIPIFVIFYGAIILILTGVLPEITLI